MLNWTRRIRSARVACNRGQLLPIAKESVLILCVAIQTTSRLNFSGRDNTRLNNVLSGNSGTQALQTGFCPTVPFARPVLVARSLGRLPNLVKQFQKAIGQIFAFR